MTATDRSTLRLIASAMYRAGDLAGARAVRAQIANLVAAELNAAAVAL